jgi:cell wall-associated NlpC family hydrolase
MKLGLCVCAGQLIAGPMLASAANAAPAAVTAKAATVTPRVTEAANKKTVTQGSTVKVVVRVVDPRTGKGVRSGSVRLQYAHHGWKTWMTKKVSSSGVATFIARPGSTLSLRSVYTGGSVIRAKVSNTIRVVTVRPKANKGAKVLAEAKKHTGALYLYGASGPGRFDCSGFTQYVYRKAVGKKLPHKANSQQKYGTAVSKSKKRVGDLIIFRTGSYGYHAAVYAGGNYVFDSPHSGARVGKHKIFSSNYVVRRLAA